MTPDTMAAIYARAFTDGRGWSADEFAELLGSPGVFLVREKDGFALGRVVLDEAELITICIDPVVQGQGRGRSLLSGFEAEAQRRGATAIFLEVAEDNAAARGLYETGGFRETGRRPGYYTRKTQTPVAAIMMRKAL